IATASMSADIQPCCPSRGSVRTFSRPWTITGSPTDRDAAVLVASWRLAHTVKKLVCPSAQALFSRSQYREVTATRNLAAGPDTVSRYTGRVATFPTTHTIVSFIASASLAPSVGIHAGAGPIRVRARPVRPPSGAATADRPAIAVEPDCRRRAGPAERCGRPPTCGYLRPPNGPPPRKAEGSVTEGRGPGGSVTEGRRSRGGSVTEGRRAQLLPAPTPTTCPYRSRTSRYRRSSAATGSRTRARPQPEAASRSRLSASSPYRRAGPLAAMRQLH